MEKRMLKSGLEDQMIDENKPVDTEVVEDTKPLSAKEERFRNDHMIAKLKKQNPNLRVIQKKGSFTISNPKAPSTLLTNLLKRTKE
jgi:hypothetical protein